MGHVHDSKVCTRPKYTDGLRQWLHEHQPRSHFDGNAVGGARTGARFSMQGLAHLLLQTPTTAVASPGGSTTASICTDDGGIGQDVESRSGRASIALSPCGQPGSAHHQRPHAHPRHCNAATNTIQAHALGEEFATLSSWGRVHGVPKLFSPNTSAAARTQCRKPPHAHIDRQLQFSLRATCEEGEEGGGVGRCHQGAVASGGSMHMTSATGSN